MTPPPSTGATPPARQAGPLERDIEGVRIGPAHIAVVIPAHNAARWIADTIASVTAQRAHGTNPVVILVDDGSSDGTADIARRALRDSGLRHDVLVSDEAQGPAAARNRGWRHAADATWIQFLDADDLLAPEKLSTQHAFTMTSSSDIAVIYSPWASLFESSGRWVASDEIRRPSIGDDPVCDLLADENFIATGSQLFRRSWLERVSGFVEGHHFVEDVELLVRLALAGGRFREAPSSTPLFFYRRHAASLTGRASDGFIEGCVRNAHLAQGAWESAGALTATRRARLAETHYMAARHYSGRNRTAFDRAVDALLAVAPYFRPRASRTVRAAAILLGYRRAEWLTARLRAVRQRRWMNS